MTLLVKIDKVKDGLLRYWEGSEILHFNKIEVLDNPRRETHFPLMLRFKKSQVELVRFYLNLADLRYLKNMIHVMDESTRFKDYKCWTVCSAGMEFMISMKQKDCLRLMEMLYVLLKEAEK